MSGRDNYDRDNRSNDPYAQQSSRGYAIPAHMDDNQKIVI